MKEEANEVNIDSAGCPEMKHIPGARATDDISIEFRKATKIFSDLV